MISSVSAGLIAAVFTLSGGSKLLRPQAPKASLRKVLPWLPAVGVVLAALAVVELLIAAVLVVVGPSPVTAVGVIGVIGGLSGYVLLAARRGASCGCFGTADRLAGRRELVRNGALMVLGALLLTSPTHHRLTVLVYVATLGCAAAVVGLARLRAGDSNSAEEKVASARQLISRRAVLTKALAGGAITLGAPLAFSEGAGALTSVLRRRVESSEESDKSMTLYPISDAAEIARLVELAKAQPPLARELATRGLQVRWSDAEAADAVGHLRTLGVRGTLISAPVEGGGAVLYSPDIASGAGAGVLLLPDAEEHFVWSGDRSGYQATGAAAGCDSCAGEAAGWVLTSVGTAGSCLICLFLPDPIGCGLCAVGAGGTALSGIPSCPNACPGMARYTACVAVAQAFCQGVSCGCSEGLCGCVVCGGNCACADGCQGVVGLNYCVDYYRPAGHPCGCTCCCLSNFGFTSAPTATQQQQMATWVEQITPALTESLAALADARIT